MPSESPPSPSRADERSPGRLPRGSRRVLFVTEESRLEAMVRQELVPGFELQPVSTLALALTLVDVEPAPAAVIIDLGHSESRKMADFLATLVERGYPGPRILLSGRFRPQEAATLSQASVIHFALAIPWAAGELRAFVEAALGFRPFPDALHPS